ncbi:MAG: DUF1579 family protein [Sediminibacterium sp.]
MTSKKINWIDSKELIQKVNGIKILKTCSVMLIMVSLFTNLVFAQNNKDTATSNSSSNGDDTFNNVLDYSRPGKYHQLLADLVGIWTFKGSSIIWVDSVTSKVTEELSGTVVRKSFANGRFFFVDATAGKIEMPIQDGKMKGANFQSHEIEGYDNVKKKFVRTLIWNANGSAILFFEGTYDSTTRTITYETEIEYAPGMKTKNRIVYIFHDRNHYKYEMYNEQNGKYIKFHEFSFIRVKGK